MRADELNWAQGQQATMGAFLAFYMLHDAVIDQFIFSADGSAWLTVGCDPVWLERPFAQGGLPSPGTENYSLYLKFAHVLGVRINEVALDTIPVVNGTIDAADTQLLSARHAQIFATRWNY
jgi:hypothetical protein